MKTLLAILLCGCLTLSAQEMSLSAERVDPGDTFILSLYGPESIGVSWILFSATTFEFVDRDMAYPDPIVPTAELNDITSTPEEYGGLIDEELVETRIQLILRAPTTPGTYLIYMSGNSVIIYAGFVIVPLPLTAIEVYVAPPE